MDRELYRRVKRVLEEALDAPESEVERLLDDAGLCGAERAEVREVIGHARGFDPELEHSPVAHVFRAFEDRMVGQIVGGRFRLLKPLGSGGMGAVHLAERTDSGEKVVVKLLHVALQHEAGVQRFRREATLLSSIEHPQIAELLDASFDEFAPYIVMRFVAGRTLDEHSAPRDADELREVLTLVASTARAVHAAHQVGVVHRDIKPQNIKVRPDGTPVVLDFGLAQTVGADQGLTATGNTPGSPHFMAPEQHRGEQADARSDVWALAVTLFAVCTGERPFGGSSWGDIRQAVLTFPTPRLRNSLPFAPAPLQTVLAKALEKSPHHRYFSAMAFAEDLERVADGRPVRARGPSLTRRLGSLVSQHPIAAVAFGCLLLVLAIVSFSLIQVREEQNASTAAVARSRELAGLLLTTLEEYRTLGVPSGELLKTLSLVANWFSVHEQEVLDEPELTEPYADFLSVFASALLNQGQNPWRLRRAAVRLRERLCEREPLVTRHRAALSIALVHLGNLYQGDKELDKAWEYYQQSLKLDEDLTRDCPQVLEYLDNLSRSHERLAVLAEMRGDQEAWLHYLARHHRSAKALLARDPERCLSLNNLAQSHLQLLTVLARAGLSPRELHVREALRLSEMALKRGPRDPKLRWHRAQAAIEGMRLAIGAGRLDEAQRLRDESSRLWDGLVAGEPGHSAFAKQSIHVLQVFVRSCLSHSHVLSAVSGDERLVEKAEQLWKRWPGHLPVICRVTYAVMALAEAYVATGDHERAHDLLRRCVPPLDIILGESPLEATALWLKGLVLLQMGQHDRAAVLLEAGRRHQGAPRLGDELAILALAKRDIARADALRETYRLSLEPFQAQVKEMFVGL